MPSYIELEQSQTFPSASAVGRMILGFNTSGSGVIVDCTGSVQPLVSTTTNNIIVSGAYVPTPAASDYFLMGSYSKWMLGTDIFGPAMDESKWLCIANEHDTTDYLNFEFIGGTANGYTISRVNSKSIRVDHTNLLYRDDGYGMYPANYFDFVNQEFVSQSLQTRITGSNSRIYANYCATDDFYLLFRETGQLNSAAITDMYYVLSAANGCMLGDLYGTTIQLLLESYSYNFRLFTEI